MINPFRKVNTTDSILNRIQDNIENTLKSFIKNELLDGIIISVSFTGSTSQIVNHKLSRLPVGWIVINKNKKTDVWVSAIDNKSLTVNVDNDVELKLFVF